MESSDRLRIIALENAILELQNERMQYRHLSQVMGNVNGTEQFSEHFDSGDTAWMLTSTALVLMMTIPGLALYYGGMVRVENVLSTAMQSFSITCLITGLWLAIGYSLSFCPARFINDSDVFSPIGDSTGMWLQHLDLYSYNQLAPSIPESVYICYQLTFAIITPALICGSVADRMRFDTMLIFMLLWHIFVYCPLAHANWHPNGFMTRMGVMDYAGGNVVHISSGIAGLVSAIVIGKRAGFGTEEFKAHNILLTFQGASLLWVGWFGFNAGSAGGASNRAGMAMLTTQISTAVASLTWLITEWLVFKQYPSVLGIVSGAVAGLVAVTPACGYVDQTGAFVIGFLAGPWCYLGAQIKHKLGYDDALDAFGVHATGGMLGGLLAGCFARSSITWADGWFYGNGHQILVQIYGILFAVGWSGAVTFVLLKFLEVTMGLRVSAADEAAGLDSSVHGETIHHVKKLTAEEIEAMKNEETADFFGKPEPEKPKYGQFSFGGKQEEGTGASVEMTAKEDP